MKRIGGDCSPWKWAALTTVTAVLAFAAVGTSVLTFVVPSRRRRFLARNFRKTAWDWFVMVKGADR